MPRIFTGLEIPAEIGRELSMLRGGLPGARWIDPENYHLTLRFIGDVDDVVAQEVASLLGMVRRTEFELRFDALAAFGGRRPRALVASLAQTQALMDLQAEHERLMRRVGLDAQGRKVDRVRGVYPQRDADRGAIGDSVRHHGACTAHEPRRTSPTH